MVLLGLWSNAEFQFRPASWAGRSAGHVREYPTLPFVRSLRALPILCVGGVQDRFSVCPRIGTPNVTARTIRAGHSFGTHAGQVYGLTMEMIRRLEGRAPRLTLPPARRRRESARV
jgi:type IV secretory pathway VirJ component